MIMHTKQTPGCAEEFLQQVHSQDDRVRSARFSVAAPSHGVHLTRWRFCTQTEARSDDTELKMSADQRYCKGQVCIYVHSPKIQRLPPPTPGSVKGIAFLATLVLIFMLVNSQQQAS